MTPIEFSVDDPSKLPMSEEDKARIAMVLEQHLKNKKK
ncbi:hypothetical protein Javan116_0002 [Streptococcus phage Javan116]|nr:hypothetical protein Javan116_0002 [Streptococcus phage Javan116]